MGSNVMPLEPNKTNPHSKKKQGVSLHRHSPKSVYSGAASFPAMPMMPYNTSRRYIPGDLRVGKPPPGSGVSISFSYLDCERPA
jgi:hypothetical protein